MPRETQARTPLRHEQEEREEEERGEEEVESGKSEEDSTRWTRRGTSTWHVEHRRGGMVAPSRSCFPPPPHPAFLMQSHWQWQR
eukprot:1347232-Pyramimonas_sp.AAC.1